MKALSRAVELLLKERAAREALWTAVETGQPITVATASGSLVTIRPLKEGD